MSSFLFGDRACHSCSCFNSFSNALFPLLPNFNSCHYNLLCHHNVGVWSCYSWLLAHLRIGVHGVFFVSLGLRSCVLFVVIASASLSSPVSGSMFTCCVDFSNCVDVVYFTYVSAGDSSSIDIMLVSFFPFHHSGFVLARLLHRFCVMYIFDVSLLRFPLCCLFRVIVILFVFCLPCDTLLGLNVGCIMLLCGKQFSHTASMIRQCGYFMNGSVLVVAHTLSFIVKMNLPPLGHDRHVWWCLVLFLRSQLLSIFVSYPERFSIVIVNRFERWHDNHFHHFWYSEMYCPWHCNDKWNFNCIHNINC